MEATHCWGCGARLDREEPEAFVQGQHRSRRTGTMVPHTYCSSACAGAEGERTMEAAAVASGPDHLYMVEG